jgi:hypothetical protein
VNREKTLHQESGLSYFIFGLHLRSNLPLPGAILDNSSANKCDLELHLGISPYRAGEKPQGSEELTYVSSDTNSVGEPALRISKVEQGAFVRLTYEDGTQFWLDRKRENIWATWPAILPLENAISYLLGPVFGLVLRLRGVICLHASAVAFENRSVAFVGSAGAGKSTTAAAFAREGYGVISDDIVALKEQTNGFQVLPAYPHLCLWPDTVHMLYGSQEALPRIIPDWEKRRLMLGNQEARFESRSLPLGAVYILGERRSERAPLVEAIRPQAALLSLVADTYANKILDQDMRAREFEFLGRLVTTVPIRRICPHRDATRLEDLCRVIRDDFALLHPTTTRP